MNEETFKKVKDLFDLKSRVQSHINKLEPYVHSTAKPYSFGIWLKESNWLTGHGHPDLRWDYGDLGFNKDVLILVYDSLKVKLKAIDKELALLGMEV